MRILVIMEGFFPGERYGGPPVSVDNFCTLMKEHGCYILATNHDLNDRQEYKGIKNGWNERNNCKVKYVPDSQYNLSTYKKVINEIKPDILYLQGLFQSCVIPCLFLAKRMGVHVLLAPRGELCAGALSIKKWKKLPYIEMVKAIGLVKNIHWQSTSDEETEAIGKLMKADASHIHRLDNIPSIPKKEYPRREKIAGEGRFVFLSRIHPKKNLLSAIKYFEHIEGKACFDIYGPIEDEDYWKQCQDVIKKLPENVKVEYKGLVSHDQVHEVFSQYDAFLFPTLSENYGHVIAESLIVGTPVIISDQTPWTDTRYFNAGFSCPLDEENEYIESINIICKETDAEAIGRRERCLNYVQNKLDIENLRINYNSTLLDLIT